MSGLVTEQEAVSLLPAARGPHAAEAADFHVRPAHEYKELLLQLLIYSDDKSANLSYFF